MIHFPSEKESSSCSNCCIPTGGLLKNQDLFGALQWSSIREDLFSQSLCDSYRQIHNYMAKVDPWSSKLHQSSIYFPFHLSS
jgi:hypothetical protein